MTDPKQSPSSAARRVGREVYRGIDLYAPSNSPCAIDLTDNTNLFGVPPSALEVLRGAGVSHVARYPSLYAGELKSALADYAGVRAEQIVTGCGSDDVLDSAFRAFAEPGDRIAHSTPTFVMVPILARMNGIESVGVPFTPDFDIDADALLATAARIIYICSPNNPTATLASAGSLARVIEHAPGVVILDEAYAEFAGGGSEQMAVQTEHVLVARTMSKAFGLAGLRIGYAAGAPELVAEVEKSRGPFKVGALAELAAVAALTNDRGWVRDQVELVRANRARFEAGLVSLGLEALPSAANFVLVPVPDAMGIACALRERGIAVRPFAALEGLGDAIRMTIGPWEMMETTLGALREALACV